MDQRRIGRYQILEEIASGGQATVYRARDADLERVVALKVLHPHLSADPQYLERFLREARMAGSLNHPNIVIIYEVGRDDGQHLIAMEHLPQSLHSLIQAEGSLPVDRAVDICRQMALGLQSAHENGIIHRDIKPQNILLGPDGTAKVTDFGIARAADLSTMTRTGMLMGTPHYMSPEQAKGERVDTRTDVYSLGCVLYQMLTGEVPFKADTPLAVIRQHIEERPRPVRTVRSEVPAAVERVVARCMEKDPGRRYQTPQQLALVLEQASVGTVPIRPRGESAPPERKPRPEAASPSEARIPPPPVRKPPAAAPGRPSRVKWLVGKGWSVGVVLWGIFLMLGAEREVLVGLLLVVSGVATSRLGILGRRRLVRIMDVGSSALLVAGLLLYQAHQLSWF